MDECQQIMLELKEYWKGSGSSYSNVAAEGDPSAGIDWIYFFRTVWILLVSESRIYPQISTVG